VCVGVPVPAARSGPSSRNPESQCESQSSQDSQNQNTENHRWNMEQLAPPCAREQGGVWVWGGSGRSEATVSNVSKLQAAVVTLAVCGH
jgi:hypothetical protein